MQVRVRLFLKITCAFCEKVLLLNQINKRGGQHGRTQLLPMRQELLFNVVRYAIIKRRGVGSVKLPQLYVKGGKHFEG